MVSRRTVLMTGGAGLVLLGGGLGGYAATRSISDAREPWRAAAEGFGDPRLDALAYAVLAPNPHNRQPWLVRLEGARDFTLFCDLERLLPETDPPNRQITIGLGCFLELMRQAAAEKGYRAQITPFPEGEPEPVLDERPIAQVSLIPDDTLARDPLFGAALERRTVRTPFDDARPVAPVDIDTLLETAAVAGPVALSGTAEAARVADLRALCQRGWDIEISTPDKHGETVDLTRVGAAQINRSPDGISVHGPAIEVLNLFGLFGTKAMNTQGSLAYSSIRSFYADAIETSRAFLWLTTPDNTRTRQLETGYAWARTHLAATRMGLAFHPLSQILQEYPEMKAPFDEVHEMLDISAPGRVQGLMRIGYGTPPGPAPRWPLTSRLVREAA